MELSPFFKSIPGIDILLFDSDLKIVFFSGEELIKLGYSEKFFSERNLLDLFQDTHRDKIETKAKDCLNGFSQSEIISKFGQMIRFEFKVLEEQKNKIGLVLVQNVTKEIEEKKEDDELLSSFQERLVLRTNELLKSKEDFLKQSSQLGHWKTEFEKLDSKFSSMIHLSPFGILFEDKTGKISFANQKSLDLLGITNEELIGKIFDETNLEKITELSDDQKESFIISRNQQKAIHSYRYKTNLEFSELAFIHFLQDETEKTNQGFKVQESRRMEALGSLSGGIVHDFNNLLQPILLFSNVLRSELSSYELPKFVEEYLQNIELSAIKSKELISQILDFSKKEEANLREIDLERSLETCYRLLEGEAKSKRISISLSLTQKKCYILGTESNIYQILTNFLSNSIRALHATTSPKITIQLSLKPNPNFPNGQVSLVFQDNGIGMQPSEVGRIFEPFYTNSSNGEGTGLGLSIVYGILKRMNGEIFIETDIGKGMKFEVLFPLVRTEEKSLAKKPSKASKLSGGSSANIILVDDDTIAQKAIISSLVPNGFQVFPFESPKEALEYFLNHQKQIDVFITDQIMPEMLGTELAREIRKKNEKLPIILLTGYDKNLDMENKPKEIDFILQKPVEFSVLKSIIDSLV